MEARTRIVVIAIAALAVAMVAWLLLDPATQAAPTPEPTAPATAASTNSPVVPATADATSAAKPAAAAATDSAEAAARIAVPVADPKLATLRGRCVDENGAPLAGCKVSLHGWTGNSQRMDAWLQEHGEEPKWTDSPEITTAADGVFVFTFWPPPPFQFTVDVRQDGRGTMGGRWGTIAEGSTKDVGDVRMGPGVQVRGRVVDDKGMPREKEYVTLRRQNEGRSPSGMEPRWGEQTISKADGSFALRDWLVPGEYAVSTQNAELQSPTKVQLVADRREEVLELVVHVRPPSETITGRVLDEAGAPVRGIEIEDRSAFGRSRASSGRDGTFKLEQRKPGGAKTASLVLSGREHEVDAAPREVAWGSQDVEFRVRKAAALTLRITDEQGAPVDNYLVRLIPRNRGRSSSRDSEPRAKGKHEDGTVVLPGLTKGDWQLMVEFAAASGFCAMNMEFTQDTGQKRLDLRAAPAQRRTLRVVGPDGPIAGTTVQLCELFGKPLTDDRTVMQYDHWLMNSGQQHALVVWEGATNRDGRAELAGPGGRELGVCVLGPGHMPLRLAPVALGVADELVVTVSRGAQLVGKVVPPEAVAELKRLAETEPGQEFPAGHAPRLTLRRDRERFPKDHILADKKPDLRLAGDGTFRVDGLPPGTWQIEVQYMVLKGGSGGSQTVLGDQVTLADGATTTLDLDLGAVLPGELEGTVLRNGQPLANGSFVLQADRGGSRVETDAQGRFRTSTTAGDYKAVYSERIDDPRQWSSIESATPIRVTRGQLTSVAVVFESGKLRATVLDGKGQPVAGVQLHTHGNDRFGQSRITDEKGVAEFELTVGTVQLRVLPKALSTPEAQQKLWREAQANGNQDPLGPHWLALQTVTLVAGDSKSVEIRLPESAGY